MNTTRNMTNLMLCCLWCFVSASVEIAPGEEAKGLAADRATISRTIDASEYFRRFPDLVGYRNTSIQKAPAPVLAEVSRREFGKPKITKCWLNLDEMWDYRTRQYDYNYRIGVHKYDDVAEKHRETWGSVRETNVHFNEYLKAFGENSDEVLLTIRRYERDILDGKLGVTYDDWKAIFKNAVRHSKQICPNLRYIEACNEYGCRGFIGCTAEEYYRFYRLAYQAVNEVNEELQLQGDDRLLVGGPAVTGDIVGKMNLFFENYSRDSAPDKRMDFVAWHEYNKPYAATAHRQEQVQTMLAMYDLPQEVPMFVTEHDPYHPPAGSREYNLINGAGLIKSLYFANRFSPNINIFPWVQYHIAEIQTRFMWFDGPNEPNTKAEELRMLPAGCSMKLLSMHKKWEIAVRNALDYDQLVLASVQNDALAVHAVNYGRRRDVRVCVESLPKVFSALGKDAKLSVVKYLVDEQHSNAVAEPDYPGGLEQVAAFEATIEDGAVVLAHDELAKNGIVFWEVTPPKAGAPLDAPVATEVAKLEAAASGPENPPLDVHEAWNNAVATPDAEIQRVGQTWRVKVSRSQGRPGIVFRPTGGACDVSGLGAVEAQVKNTGKHSLPIHLVMDNPNADRGMRRGCCILSTHIPPGKTKTLRLPISARPPIPLEAAFRGMRGTPGGAQGRSVGSLDASNVALISVYVYKPGGEYTFEVSELRAGSKPVFPLPEKLKDLFPMIDRFGQYMHKDWPDKTHSEDDLASQRDREQADLAAHPGPRSWNQYGGWAAGPKLDATGRFRVTKWRDKWWLVDPEGRLFWSHGLVRVTWSCGYTPITGRRFLFADLPGTDSPFAAFYGRSTWAIAGLYDRGTETYNFTGANLLRKYGPQWMEVFADVTHRRLRSWGLNTMANCSQPAIYLQKQTPYTATVYSLHSPPEDTPGGTGYVATIHDDSRVIEKASGGWGKFPDVFDPSFKATLLAEVAQHKDKAVGDPWCVGYFLGNELTWGRNDTWLARAVLKSPANQPAKRVLVDDLKAKYETIDGLNAAWKTEYSSWHALLHSTDPPEGKNADEDLTAFLDKTADAYFRQCREAVKETDPTGLYLGCRFAGWANTRVFRAAAKYADVISVNRYSAAIDDLRLPENIDKPVVIGEFHFGALDRGKFHASLHPVPNQMARGEAYEQYVRSGLKNPLVVGTHWHQYGDQATTGRDDGENYQNGFIDVCDTPYVETIEGCRRVGYRLYEIRAGASEDH